MKTSHFSEEALRLMRHETGVVIPVYIPENAETDHGQALLRDTVLTFTAQVSDPAAICLSVDGEECGVDIVRQLAGEFQVSWCVCSVNRGKLQGVVTGVRELLERKTLQYIAVIDQDGDHFANELLNFVRAAHYIATYAGIERVLVLGQRVSRHHSMGFARGDLEELCDRMLLDALMYRAVMKQQPLPLENAFTVGEFPDFHSGYKLFSRSTAEAVFLSPTKQMGLSETCYYRHACEAVMTVEALEQGAYLGIVNRSTFNEQPLSTFGKLDRVQLTADMIIWPCKRLAIPLPFVEQWLANHISRLFMATLVPEGRTELEQVQRLVLTTLAGDADYTIRPLLQPLFL